MTTREYRCNNCDRTIETVDSQVYDCPFCHSEEVVFLGVWYGE